MKLGNKTLKNLILFLSLFVMFHCIGAQESTKEKEPIKKEEKQNEERNESKEKESSRDFQDINYNRPEDIDIYRKNPGFKLVPASRYLNVRNIFKYYMGFDSNMYLDDRNPEESFLYGVDLETNITYRTGRLKVQLMGGINFSDHFTEDDIDKIHYRANLGVSYSGKIFYLNLTDSVRTDSLPLNLEKNDRTGWLSNTANLVVGSKYQRFFGEISTSHTYMEYFDFNGDYQRYSQSYILGYKISKRLDTTLQYGWFFIDYINALTPAESPALTEDQDDVFGQNVLVGLRFDISEKFYGELNTGVDFVRSQVSFHVMGRLTWKPSPKLKGRFEVSRKIDAGLFGDYRINTNATISFDYLFTYTVAGNVGFSVLHTKPEEGDSIWGYRVPVSLNWRIYKGIEAEAYYTLSINEGRTDYIRHYTGISINIVF